MKNGVPVLLDFTVTPPHANFENCSTEDENQHGVHNQSNNPSRPEHMAVCVQNVYKSYVNGRPTLKNLTMNVKAGTIYSLLGASGCGKSTLLSAIVGLSDCDSGEIYICNKRVTFGQASTNVGFMPQDIALHDHLSIMETMYYYSKLYGMTKEDAEIQLATLIKFLQLPSKYKLIRHLSGGTRRRCSLAVALLSRPAVLILDEPTVGLDPLVRDSIWQYFRSIVKYQHQTIILSTHFIEEARQSDMLGVMRNGRIIAEESPKNLLLQRENQMLADIVLNICQKDEQLIIDSGHKATSSKEICGSSNHGKYQKLFKKSKTFRLNNDPKNSLPLTKFLNTKDESDCKYKALNRRRAYLNVIWLFFKRNPTFFALVLLMPLIHLVVTLAVLGSTPKGMKLGVVNYDVPDLNGCSFGSDLTVRKPTTNLTSLPEIETQCDFRGISCRFIKELSRSRQVNLISFKSEREGYNSILAGKTWGYLSFPKNYSKNFQIFAAEQKFADNATLEGIKISLRLDMSHYLAYRMIIGTAYDAFAKFISSVGSDCDTDPRKYAVPLSYRNNVFGRKSANASYQDYEIPVLLVIVIFELPMAMSAILYMKDRNQGTLTRSQVAGLSLLEIMTSHVITQGVLVIFQGGICWLFLYYTFNVSPVDSPVLCFVLTILPATCGAVVGLLLGVTFQEEVEAFVVAMFICPNLFLLGGALWPIECMPLAIRKVVNLLPTRIIESLRSVIYRGVGLDHNLVWPGIAVMLFWILFLSGVVIILAVRTNKR